MPLHAPDVEAALLGLLASAGTPARDVLGPPYPSLRLVRVGGTRERVADTALIQLECAGGTDTSKALVLSRLEDAISTLRAGEGSTVAGAVVTAVQVFGAPTYLPDGVDGAPRYAATLTVTSRAVTPQTT